MATAPTPLYSRPAFWVWMSCAFVTGVVLGVVLTFLVLIWVQAAISYAQ